ncbi:translation initiation factor IF-2-like [Sciurus carolinensis]|uniref:translation initiation factor IF-2-like n=1 Tax=Sciurus carolinensis TaxID=30640 RepID=UPI001FB39736|nr:translation initiation factor IF-2-like [Sciurus carolinensis]
MTLLYQSCFSPHSSFARSGPSPPHPRAPKADPSGAKFPCSANRILQTNAGQNPLPAAETQPQPCGQPAARHAGPRTGGQRGRREPSPPHSGRLNLPPALAPRRRGCAAPARVRRGPAGRPRGRSTRARTASHGRPLRVGRRRATPAGARKQRSRSPCSARAAPRAVLPTRLSVRLGATYLGAGRLQRTPAITGRAANCPGACALQASGPDPGQKGKQRARRPLAATPESASGSLLSGSFDQALTWPSYSGGVFRKPQIRPSGLTTK